ncbi:hypothetical protein [Mycobacterium arosiense]|uniref:Uncharacterized protein n=1 Tax=Mycobacterium arosiense ATCC BAA-1401 = DSM 45069 TaxID=1265311 RepID=A0A1W9ZCN4_MYCAI|nr:hypothetical protein [Mycobacterium arosiense]ORA11965.1 hypothetical protein BST14_17790 [Mycobacterium arosiense ATCC BAA-1401 = DSM 45069]
MTDESPTGRDVVDAVTDAAVDNAVKKSGEPQSETEGVDKPKKAAKLQVSVSLRSLMVTGLVVVFIAAVGVLGWLYYNSQKDLNALHRQAESNARAEKIALDYAVNAAQMKFDDLGAWKVKLVEGTSPELKKKLTDAATSMEQILVPLQWSSTAKPVAAKVRSENGGVFVVDAFVSVLTKTIQAPEALQSTATYSVTVDSSKNGQISDVGGVGDVVGGK